MRDIALYHLPVFLYGAMILAVSSIPHLKSPEVGFFANDKIIHFLEYAVFAFLAQRSALRRHQNVAWRRAFQPAWLALVLLAAVDEVLQGFIPGRHSDLADFAADLAGGSLVLLICLWRYSKRLQSEP